MSDYFQLGARHFIAEQLPVAIDADQALSLDLPFCGGTYANILMRPSPNDGTKDSPIPLLKGEVERVKSINPDPRAWPWIAGSDHTRFIYNEGEDGTVKVSSISAWYSNSALGNMNRVKVLQIYGNWLKIETLKAGSDWWRGPIPEHLLHRVWSLTPGNKIIDNPPGAIYLPLITRDGFGWISRKQVTGL